MTQKEFEKRVEKLMKTGRYSLEECQQLVLDDEKVDKGEPLPWDLTKEEKANQKERIKIPTEKLRKYFPKNYTVEQIENEIIKLCEKNYRMRQRDAR